MLLEIIYLVLTCKYHYLTYKSNNAGLRVRCCFFSVAETEPIIFSALSKACQATEEQIMNRESKPTPTKIDRTRNAAAGIVRLADCVSYFCSLQTT